MTDDLRQLLAQARQEHAALGATLERLEGALGGTPNPGKRRVPYLSQWGPGADVRKGDCGPACIAMIVHYLTHHRPTVDGVAAACGQPGAGEGSQYTGHAQLRQGALVYGVRLETRSPYTDKVGLSLDLLRRQVDAGLPSIALVHYGVLRDFTNGLPHIVSNQDRNFRRGHWFLVVDYDEDFFYVNDPDFWKERVGDGTYRRIPRAAFEAALATPAPGCTVGYQGLIVRRET